MVDELHQAIADGVEFPAPARALTSSAATSGSSFVAPPCFMLFTGPNQVVWYRIDPLTTDRSRLLTTILVPKRYRDLPQFEACKATARKGADRFPPGRHGRVRRRAARFLHQRVLSPGRLSHLEMPIWLFYRYLAARIRNTRPTVGSPRRGKPAWTGGTRPGMSTLATAGADDLRKLWKPGRIWRDGAAFPEMVDLPLGLLRHGRAGGRQIRQ